MRVRAGRRNWWGITGAHLSGWAALGPSLLPRTWWSTGISVGFASAFGYAVGSISRALYRGVRSVTHPRTERRRRVADRGRLTGLLDGRESILLATLTAGTAIGAYRASRRQVEIAALVEEPAPTPASTAEGIAVGGVIATGAVLLVRLFQYSSATSRRILYRIAPALAAPLSGTIVTFALTYWLNRSVLWDQIMRRVNRVANENNARALLPLREPPLNSERSGSPDSFEPFQTLGRHGKAIVAEGPRAADISAVTGRPAREPIRAYVGLRPDVSIAASARAAVRELDRAGGFERRHLAVFIGTGTGWLNDWALNAFEFLTEGDCAIVSLQYTVLPSAFAFLVDRQSPRESAEYLVRAVSDALDRRPADAPRPRIYLSGESLGAFGGLSVFADADDMIGRIDGAVWAGTPQFTPIRRELERRRARGSLCIRPEIDGGRHIRFSARDSDLFAPGLGAWALPRIVFLQHASDPVAWWDARLLWQEPEWLREPAGEDVTPAMRWWPWVTHWQLAADMPRSIANPGGHAHRYHEEYIAAWANVLDLDPQEDRTATIRAIRHLIRPK